MSQYSPYAVNESLPPKWLPQEQIAAAAFLGIALWLCLDTQVCIIRTFKKRSGLYYWTIQLSVFGTSLDGLGVILKYFTPGATHYWWFYTFCLLTGWGIYAPGQLLVLYSRLHLVNSVPWIQRLIFWTIISTVFTCILPTWVVIWHSYNPDPAISSLWSPRNAIIERYTQIAFTLVEFFISGIYIYSLLSLLSHKSTVRQRRVMKDLIYVNVLCVTFDIITVILIYLNRLGISHPIQTFSYALKLKLEFLVLNQLMAVAARGIQRKSWEHRRYNTRDEPDNFSAQCRQWAGKGGSPKDQLTEHEKEVPTDPQVSQSSDPLPAPPPTLNRASHASESSIVSLPPPDDFDASKLDGLKFGKDPRLSLRTFFDERGSSSRLDLPQSEPPPNEQPLHMRPSQTFSGETLSTPKGEAREESPHLFPRRQNSGDGQTGLGKGRSNLFQSIADKITERRNGQQYRSQETQQKRRSSSQTIVNPNDDSAERLRKRSAAHDPNRDPPNVTIRRPNPRKTRHDDDEDDTEEIGVHMWERRGTTVLDAPWLAVASNPERKEDV